MKQSLHFTLFQILFHLFVAAVVPTTLFSQPFIYENGAPSRPELLGQSSVTRSIIDLSGTWEYSLDAGQTWKKVNVPSAFDYEGKITFRRKFEISSDQVTNNSFKFFAYGINYSADIFINENFVGKHEGGYTSFSFAVPENIIQIGNENVIRIVVDNTLNYTSTLPVRQQVFGWKNYGGILRDIFLVTTPRVWIDNVSVSLEGIDAKNATLRISSAISSKNLQSDSLYSEKNLFISAEITETSTGASVNKINFIPFPIESNKDIVVPFTAYVSNPKLWTPDTPELYTVKISITTQNGKSSRVIDHYVLSTGIRTVTRDKNTVLLNGVPLNFRGVIYVEDSKEHGGAVSYEDMERDVALIKNLGANAVRIGFHPPHPFFIYLCDKYGLFVFEEIPLYEIPSTIFLEENYRALTENYLKEMIQRDRSNPSVIAWGFGEGFGISSPESGIVSQLHIFSKSIDERFTYYVSRVIETKGNSNITDLAMLSFGGSDAKEFRANLTKWKIQHKEHPVFVGAFGKNAEPSNRNGYSDPMSQEAQARFFLQRYTIIKDLKISGGFIWSFADWKGDRPILRVHQENPNMQTAGIVELDRKKKISYDVIRSAFLDEKVSALPFGTYVQSSPYVYVVIGLFLLIIFAWFVNGNRRFQENVFRASLRPHNFFTDIRELRSLPMFNTIFVGVIVATTYGVVFSSILHHFRNNALLDYSLSFFFSDDLKLIFIQMAWNPLLCIAYVVAALLLWYLVITFVIIVTSIVFKIRIYFFHSFSVAIWSTLPFALYLIVSMILYRIMESPVYVLPILLSVAAFQLLILIRTLKGMSVLFNMYPTKIYIVGCSLVFILAGGIFAYLEYTRSFIGYAKFFLEVIVPFFS